MLSLQSLTISRGRRVLIRELSAEIGGGEVVHLVGPNGAGKSTLLATLAGLRDPDAGGILWNGMPLKAQREDWREALCLLTHRAGMGRRSTAVEALRLAATLAGQENADLLGALAAVGMRSAAHRQLDTLSAGQQRRVALARLLLGRKSVWLLDEPLTALDVDGVALVERLLDSHRQAGGLAIVTSHQPLSLDGVRTLAV